MKDFLSDINKIQKAIREKTLVIFVGAGVSANSGVPTWGQLINWMANELNIDKDIQENEYLKIAQYYYNDNPKRFLKSIENFLHRDWQPNTITEYLFKEFSPQYFVTTNYDNILEQTSNKLSIPYMLIAQDEEIPKIGNNNAIIKMHGDFNHKNIVLKEDDYLKYSENYRLMEVFIKSLFATNTILFVGFSADDPNVNQIYSWVNNILRQNQREVYLLQINDVDADYELKRKYFDKKGIRIINYNELIKPIERYIKEKYLDNELKTIKDEKGKQLYKLLHFIKNATPNIFEQCYQRLLPTRYMNYLSDKEISKVINNYWSCYNGILSTSNDKNMGKLIKFLEGKKTKAKEIKELLAHLGINKLIEKDWKKDKIIVKNKLVISSAHAPELNSLDLINEFNYIEAEKYLGNINDEQFIDEYIDKSINSVNVFEKVNILLKLHRYELAYNMLKRISYKAKKADNNFIFVISEFNKKVVFNYYHWDCYYNCSDEKKQELDDIQRSCWAINIPNMMAKLLTEEERNIIQDKLNFKFIQNLDNKILKDALENTQTKFCLKELYNIFSKNYIFIDNYQEFQKLCKHCISSELDSIKSEEDNINSLDYFSTYQNHYDYLDLLLIIRYAKTSDLNNITFSNKIKELPLKEEADKIKLLNAYNNLINSISHFNLCEGCSHGNKYLEYLNKFFIVLKILPLNKSEITTVIENYLSLIRHYGWYEDFYTTNNLLFYLLNFIISNHNNSYGNTNLNSQILGDFLVYIVNNSSKIKDAVCDKLQVIRFVDEISSILKQIEPNLCISSFEVSEKTNFATRLYSFIYKLTDKSTKKIIEKLIVNELKNNFHHELYQYACLECIVQPNIKYEQKLVQEIEDRIVLYNKLKKDKPNTRNGFTNNPVGLDDIYDILKTIANLLNFEKLENFQIFEQYKNHKDFETYDYFLFSMNMKSYNYKNFKLSYLNYLTKRKKEELRQLLNSDLEKKDILKKKFFNEISLDKDTNNRLRDIILNLLYDEPLKE